MRIYNVRPGSQIDLLPSGQRQAKRRKGGMELLFDSHTHINEKSYSEKDREAIFAAIEESQVSNVMDIGFDLTSSELAVKHAERFDWCHAVVGFHPHGIETMTEEIYEGIKALALENREQVKAIGEIGLDYHYNGMDKEKQHYWFRRQIRLGIELELPIVIHSRDADQDTMNILKEEGAFSESRCQAFPPRRGPGGVLEKDARVLLHCFSGSRETGQQYVKLGATLSVAGPVTYNNGRKLAEVVAALPIEYLLIETDAPYLTPEPLRGKARNMSPYIIHTARRVALLKGISLEEAARATSDNAKVFFGIA